MDGLSVHDEDVVDVAVAVEDGVVAAVAALETAAYCPWSEGPADGAHAVHDEPVWSEQTAIRLSARC